MLLSGVKFSPTQPDVKRIQKMMLNELDMSKGKDEIYKI